MVQGSRFGYRVRGQGLGAREFSFRVWDLGFRVHNSRLMVQGSGFRVYIL
jgi:hypothetical protein